jgi:hypothetical protein
LLVACSDATEAAAPAAPPPIVPPVDLAVTKRHAGRPNPRAAIVEISPTAIALDGQKLVDLAGGRIPEAAIRQEAFNELVLRSQGLASRGVVIRMHALTRYDVMLQVLRGLSNVPNVGFAVRAGMTPEMGLLAVERFEVRAPSETPVEFPAPYGHEWSEVVALWDEIHSRCEGETAYQCEAKPERVAEGGKVEIALFTQQDAFVIDFRRFGTDDPPAPVVEWLPPQRGTDGEDREMQRLPPATRASFFWFRAATQQAESPLALALRPLCQATACGVRVSAPPATSAGQVLILIGAAFPDGFAPPRVVLETGSR